MAGFDVLVEARIQDWLKRGRPRPKHALPSVGQDSIGSQLVNEIVALRAIASEQADLEERARLLKEANHRRIQLMVMLEKAGLHLAAQNLEKYLATSR